MKLIVSETSSAAGRETAKLAASYLNECIKRKGSARIVLSTGASQFPFFEAIVKENVDWPKVEMFHLDEYVGIAETHKASFRKYLKERFTSKVNLKAAYFIDGNGDIESNIKLMTDEISRQPIDLGLIGIGENAHIAFNDPPADFEDTNSFKVVALNDECKKQQLREGWFANISDVCTHAITMTCKQIMKCRKILCLVPYEVKSLAIKNTFENELTPMIPATLLKKHRDCTVICDKDSASGLEIDKAVIA